MEVRGVREEMDIEVELGQSRLELMDRSSSRTNDLNPHRRGPVRVEVG